MNVEDNELETNAMVNYRGEVTLFRAMITDIACTLTLSMFPFDQVGEGGYLEKLFIDFFKQVCYLTFASWSMDGSKMLLAPSNSSDSLEVSEEKARYLRRQLAKVQNF